MSATERLAEFNRKAIEQKAALEKALADQLAEHTRIFADLQAQQQREEAERRAAEATRKQAELLERQQAERRVAELLEEQVSVSDDGESKEGKEMAQDGAESDGEFSLVAINICFTNIYISYFRGTCSAHLPKRQLSLRLLRQFWTH